MTTRYQSEHYEDVAGILKDQLSSTPPLNWVGHIAETETNATVKRIAGRFADLFAADNPSGCGPGIHDGPCFYSFDRKQFLAACGLES